MTMWPFLMTPWQATPRVFRLGLLLAAAACLVYGASIAFVPASRGQWSQFVSWYGGALGALWALVLSRFVLLARDRIQLVLPGNIYFMPASFAFYALCGLAPAVALGIEAHAPLPATAITLLLFMAAGLTVALLPGYVAAVVGFIPLVGAALSGYMHAHALTVTQTDAVSLVALFVLSACCLLRWRAVSRSDSVVAGSARSALIFQILRQPGQGGTRRDEGEPRWPRGMRGWSAGVVSLRNTGPASMSRALRVALGGLYLPRTLAGHARRWLPLAMLVLVMALLTRAASGSVLSTLWSPSNIAFAVCYVALVLAMASTFGVLKVMQQRWRKHNAELALLALLPGLGTPEAARQNVLRACLAGPLALHAAILATVWLTAWLIPTPSLLVALLSIVIPGCSVIMVASVLATLGGRRLPDWAMVALVLVFLALANVCVLPVVLFHAAGPVTTAYLAVPLAGWVLLGLVMLWLGFRRSMGSHRRPHVFLPEAGERSS